MFTTNLISSPSSVIGVGVLKTPALLISTSSSLCSLANESIKA